jgi:hypothetical protein
MTTTSAVEAPVTVFPFRAQAVGQQGEVEVTGASGGRDLLHVGELVRQDRLAVVQQPAHQGGLAVIHRPGGGQSKERAHQK